MGFCMCAIFSLSFISEDGPETRTARKGEG